MMPALIGVSKSLEAVSLKNAAAKKAEELATQKLTQAELQEKLIKQGFPANIAAEVAKRYANTTAMGAEAVTGGILNGVLGVMKSLLLEIVLPMMAIAAVGAGVA